MDKNSNVVNVEWDSRVSIENPDILNSQSDKNTIAHYILQIASVTETQLTGRSENARALVTYLYDLLGSELLETTNESKLGLAVENCPFYRDFGPEKKEIPRILISVNKYAASQEHDLLKSVSRKTQPTMLVNELSTNIHRMNGVYIEKAWMYLNWCTRNNPDLGLFTWFNPRDLKVYLTSYIREVACCLELCPTPDTQWWLDNDEREKVREELTNYARELFPEDPCKICYPFYLLGRWIHLKPHTTKTITDYLDFFDILYKKTGTTPINFDIVTREMSSFEKSIETQLQNIGLMYYYESEVFNLPGGYTYRPDFILPNNHIQGKKVLLEPHGVWDHPSYRSVNIGGRRMSFHALEEKPSLDETKFVSKMNNFKQTFGNEYHLVLIVPPQVKERVKYRYPDIADSLYEPKDLPQLLYKLK